MTTTRNAKKTSGCSAPSPESNPAEASISYLMDGPPLPEMRECLHKMFVGYVLHRFSEGTLYIAELELIRSTYHHLVESLELTEDICGGG